MAKPDEKLLEDLCIQTSEYLWKMETSKDVKYKGQRLLYPTYSQSGSKNKHVSDQEARFTFVEVLARRKEVLFYTIETPINLSYSFSGNGYKVHLQI